MKAIVVEKAQHLEVQDIPQPTPGPGEVLIKMEWGGICGSDLSYWQNGASGTAILREPLVLGHEVAGHIAQLGEGVTSYQVGQNVTVHPATLVGDHTMPAQLEGRDNLWPECRYFGSAAFLPHEQGGFSEYRVVRKDQIRKLPDNVSTKEGAVAEPLGVAMHAIHVAGDLTGKNVLVNGAGPIGALCVAVAKYAGAKQVWASDIADAPLKVAKAMGADHVINRANGDELPNHIDVTFEASGVPAVIPDMLLATERGGTIVQVGNLPADACPVALGQLVTREITYKGSYRFIDEITDAIEAMANGLDVHPLITHEFDIDDAQKAFETAKDKSTGSAKVLIKLS
ncbi:L-idonate 5-dehydrogenase [Actinotignum urinale]|uniref:L-idonate 5-dehydrogenase n=1 Tax=Actinotignum urinale TaxID=190146 RepID=UPI002A83C62A|nr:L-idonate 5-dehydrogenase [Actinotignum urinale]MDY5128831.1 L-idonate 5-dehydrogenase [Actinotignum urinale]